MYKSCSKLNGGPPQLSVNTRQMVYEVYSKTGRLMAVPKDWWINKTNGTKNVADITIQLWDSVKKKGSKTN